MQAVGPATLREDQDFDEAGKRARISGSMMKSIEEQNMM